MDNTKKQVKTEQDVSGSEYFSYRLIDTALQKIKLNYFDNIYESNRVFLTKAGLYGLYIAPILGLLVALVLAVRFDLPWGVMTSIGIAVLFFIFCIVTHFLAVKFLHSTEMILQSTPSKIGSTAFLDSLAILAMLLGAGALIGSTVIAIKWESFDIWLGGIFVFILCLYTISLCFKPSALNIQVDTNSSAAEELIGLLSFFIKSMVKMSPIYFGSAVLFGSIELISIIFEDYTHSYEIIADVSGAFFIFLGALIPLITYLTFVTYYFFMDIVTSILSIKNMAK